MIENSTYNFRAYPDYISGTRALQVPEKQGYVLFIGECGNLPDLIKGELITTKTLSTGEQGIRWLKERRYRSENAPEVIIINTVIPGLRPFDFVRSLSGIDFLKNVPIIFITSASCSEERDHAIRVGASDYFNVDIKPEDLLQRISFLTRLKELHNEEDQEEEEYVKPPRNYKIWEMKRVFDLILASLILLIVSPVMILIALAIKLDSKGPVLYVSKRAGKGYRIFDFYKFRTMKLGAESEMENLRHLNLYKAPKTPEEEEALFFKAYNDPRATSLGRFLRRMSLDEFPQLFNVIKGDMSMVGNRPLPLYEAEKLTKDQWALRFAAPAGITGLWQLRKNDCLSDQERIEMDITYAKDNSFLSDLKIILKTPLVLFQKEEK